MSDIFKAKDRFDLEQQILDCWKVTDDIDLFYYGMETMDEDRQMNFLLGFREMYELKFNRLWETFEQLVQDKKIV